MKGEKKLSVLTGLLGVMFMLVFVLTWRPDDGMLILVEWAAVCLLIGLVPARFT